MNKMMQLVDKDFEYIQYLKENMDIMKKEMETFKKTDHLQLKNTTPKLKIQLGLTAEEMLQKRSTKKYF